MENLVLLELNEVIFPYVDHYVRKGRLSNFKKLLERFGYGRTTSEATYSNLEPWIQWVSAHTGLTYSAHQIFRLGDIVGKKVPQIFEILEGRGVSVGAVSPMNAENRLRKAAFFVPDPWTRSAVSGTPDLRRLYDAIASTVNENATGRLTATHALYLLEGLIRHGSVQNALLYLQLALASRKRPWRRALFLDVLMSDLFLHLWSKKRPQFAVLFLNAAAHVQHHYLFSSDSYRGEHRNPSWYVPQHCDPVLEIYEIYDRILGRFLNLKPEPRLLIATGLSQEPYPSPIYYYRLQDHKGFLRLLGISAANVQARMSRDFLAEFSNAEQAAGAQLILESVRDDNNVTFFEVDNRGSSLFISFVYPNEIRADTRARYLNGDIADLHERVAFVALKNGHHVPMGYFIDTGQKSAQSGEVPVTKIFDMVLAHF
jgi:hypothetical protein